MTSLLRPGTIFTVRVSTSTTSIPADSSVSYTGIQYTLVDSIAADSTLRSFIHAAMRSSSFVVVPKCSTSCVPSSLRGPQT